MRPSVHQPVCLSVSPSPPSFPVSHTQPSSPLPFLSHVADTHVCITDAQTTLFLFPHRPPPCVDIVPSALPIKPRLPVASEAVSCPLQPPRRTVYTSSSLWRLLLRPQAWLGPLTSLPKANLLYVCSPWHITTICDYFSYFLVYLLTFCLPG